MAESRAKTVKRLREGPHPPAGLWEGEPGALHTPAAAEVRPLDVSRQKTETLRVLACLFPSPRGPAEGPDHRVPSYE